MATAQVSSEAIEQLKRNLADRNWRLCNLYWITDRDGKRVRFSPNWMQQRLMEEWHYRNIILKSRQTGCTTFIQLLFLDLVLFNSNMRCGTIAQDRDTAKAIFADKIKYPFENLPEALQAVRPPENDNLFELKLNNNSSIRVGTSMRGGTLQYLHVSEFGKVCARFPEKAREIVTGALNTVKAGQFVFIESTAEGQDGQFYKMTEKARSHQRMGSELSVIDYKFHFFGWWEDPNCWIEPAGIPITAEAQKYFDHLENEHSITLDAGQKAWWTVTKETQDDDMGREYPAHPDEAFAAAVDGSYYGRHMAAVEKRGGVGKFEADPNYPVQTFHDIGVHDYHSIWFAQFLPGEIRHLHYYQNCGEGMPHYAEYCEEQYDKHGWLRNDDSFDWLPHDGKVKEWGTGKTRTEQAIEKNMRPRIPTALSLADGRNAVRAILKFSTFDQEGCAEGIAHLKNYKKKWNPTTGAWMNEHLHNEACFTADTIVLTENGPCEMKNLPSNGKVLTPCGMKKYKNLGMTRANAQLVAVTFRDGLTVRCTPEHLFFTVDGWKSAKDLSKGTLIQSSLNQASSISTGASLGYTKASATIAGTVTEGAWALCDYTAPSGKKLLVQSRAAAMSIIETTIAVIINSGIWNACQRRSIYSFPGRIQNHSALTILRPNPESGRLSGTGLKLGGLGTDNKLKNAKSGLLARGRTALVSIAERYSLCSPRRKSQASFSNAIARENADRLPSVARVEFLSECEDVYDIEVPGAHCFSLANGAVVHNSHGADAERTLACAHREVVAPVVDPEEEERQKNIKAQQARVKAAQKSRGHRRGTRRVA